MRKAFLIFFALLTFFGFGQDNTPIGTWRMHLPYNSIRQIAEHPKWLYVVAEKGMYTHDLQSGEITFLTKIDGFAETEVTKIAYSKTYDVLVVAYKNTNVDLVKGNRIINLPGILRSSIVGVKEIVDIKIYDNLAYLSCSFGVVVIDLEREEIKDDFQNLGPNGTKLSITTSAIYNDSIYIGTPEGLLVAPAYDDQVNLKNFSSWTQKGNYDSVYHLQDFNGGLYIVDDKKLERYDNGASSQVEGGQPYAYKSLVVSNDELVICRTEGIISIATNGAITDYGERFMDYAIKDRDYNLWFGGFYSGLIKKLPSGQLSWLTPKGPFGISSFEMKGRGNEMWVTSGGHTSAYAPTFNSFGYYRYQDGDWTNKESSNPTINSMYDFTSIEFDPQTGDEWLGSYGTGLLHLRNGVLVEQFLTGNSALQFAPDNQVTVLGLGLDSKRNLWISNYETTNALVVRRPDGTWQDFLVPTKRLGEMIVDENDQLWISVERDNSKGILVFKEGEPGSPRILGSGVGGGNLPNNNIKALAMDKDGEIWVGTETGIAVFYNPSLVFDGGSNADAQQIIIDDGNDVGYLLGNEVVNDIKIDGANRKWVASNNGAWLVSADGSKILNHFTTANTPLPSNVVNTLDIIPQSGEVFFGTNDGIASFRGDATEAKDVHSNALVYPNPVHSGYEGLITITGLPEDATVKIADVAGRVVYELIANGGTAVWDGRNFNGERPQTGVYLIYTANKDDEDSLVSKLLLVR